MVVSRNLPHKSVCTSPTRLKNLSGDTEVTGTDRYCLVIRSKSGNSYWYWFHHIRGSVSLDTCWTWMYGWRWVLPFDWGHVEIHGWCTHTKEFVQISTMVDLSIRVIHFSLSSLDVQTFEVHWKMSEDIVFQVRGSNCCHRTRAFLWVGPTDSTQDKISSCPRSNLRPTYPPCPPWCFDVLIGHRHVLMTRQILCVRFQWVWLIGKSSERLLMYEFMNGHSKISHTLSSGLKFFFSQKSSQIFIVWHTVTGGTIGTHIIRESGLSLCVWGPRIQSNPYCICQFPNLINYHQQTLELSVIDPVQPLVDSTDGLSSTDPRVGWYHGWSYQQLVDK
jgi:hypothetical protein